MARGGQLDGVDGMGQARFVQLAMVLGLLNASPVPCLAGMVNAAIAVTYCAQLGHLLETDRLDARVWFNGRMWASQA